MADPAVRRVIWAPHDGPKDSDKNNHMISRQAIVQSVSFYLSLGLGHFWPKNGNCILCAGHLCADRLQLPYHYCPYKVKLPDLFSYPTGSPCFNQDNNPKVYNAAYDKAKQVHLLSLIKKVDVRALTNAATSPGGRPYYKVQTHQRPYACTNTSSR